MVRCAYRAEVIKNSHTASEKAAVLMAVLAAAVPALLSREYYMVNVLNWWYIALLPGMMAVICGGVCKREQRSEYRNILTLPIDVKAVWDAKVLYLARLLFLSGISVTGIAVLMKSILKYGMHTDYVWDIDYKSQVVAMLILTVTFLWQIPFCMILEQLMGMPLMLAVHMLLYVVTACSLSLKSYFMVFPGAVPARLMCVILGILPNGLPAREGMETFSPELLDESMMGAGIFSALLWFIFLWIFARRIYERKVLGE